MENTNIISLITGETHEEVKKLQKRNKRLNELRDELTDEIFKITENNNELIRCMVAVISTMILDFPKEAKMNILSILLKAEIEGIGDRIMEQINKFKDEEVHTHQSN